VSLLRRSASLDHGLLDLLLEASGNAERTARLLRDMLAAFPERAELARDILLCEQEGERITHDLMHRLNLNGADDGDNRGDVHALAGAIDDVVDDAEQTADYLGLYAIEAPMQQAEELAEVLLGATQALKQAIASLRSGAEASAHLIEVHRLENDGDRLSRDAVAALFRGGIDPMVVIRWKDIFESLESAIDACETAAHLVEGMELRRGR
jgi:uncharacterized protein Yka (UPF0111/DUF47 family)